VIGRGGEKSRMVLPGLGLAAALSIAAVLILNSGNKTIDAATANIHAPAALTEKQKVEVGRSYRLSETSWGDASDGQEQHPPQRWGLSGRKPFEGLEIGVVRS